ncbi:TM1802 family CRISPR-associated protein [Tepidibacillus infernus]|uniref:TM1802 family CRISPR-associated protein n=1 Tax=Tepidibacillus infernus TaxID=1806172 RepID=UPI003B68FA1E
MNLPQITAYIGAKQRRNQQPLDSRIKTPKLNLKENEQAYILFMTFDLDRNQIFFDDPLPYNEQQPKAFNYFGNNPGASSQSYVVREVGSLYYLLTTVWNDLFISLKQQSMEECELAQLILELQENSLVTLGDKLGEGNVQLERIYFPPSKETSIEINKEKKAIILNGKEYKGDAFIQYLREDDHKRNKYLLIIPRVHKNGEKTIISQHPDYIQFVMRKNKIGVSVTKVNKVTHEQEERVCYLCHAKKADVSIKNSTKFSLSGINKFFTTTTINSSRYHKSGTNYDDVYSFCGECYQDLLAGENAIEQRLVGRIARERVFILPEGLLDSFDYDYITKIKDHIDFAFKSKDAEEWLKNVEAESKEMEQSQYIVHFIVYRTDGKSVTLLDSFEDVPVSRFLLLNRMFSSFAHQIKPHIKGFSLGSIYHIIPVRESDKGQVDVGRVLSMYKAILSGYLVERETIYAYASEALDKGMRQLSKNRIDNYKNLKFDFYHKNELENFFIKRIVMSYLVFMQTLQALNILNKPFFQKSDKEGEKMNEANNNSKYLSSINEMENFIAQQGFTSEAKALFFLGTLLHRVAVAQYQKEHKTKPILKKIQFQGMDQHEILRLYKEIIEKLRQYNKMTLFSEHLMNRYHHYHGVLRKDWPLSDHANVFYIMAGYAYMVGNMAPDLSKAEIASIEAESDIESIEE